MLKKILIGSAVAVLSVAGFAAHAEDLNRTIAGEPVDISCFLAGKSGEAHAACAKGCAEKGNPLGIAAKDADGKDVLYLALGGGGKEAKDLLGPVMGKKVKVTGVVTEKGGMKAVTISKVDAGAPAWKPATTGSASIQNSTPKVKKPE
jgi:hypothetical protein